MSIEILGPFPIGYFCFIFDSKLPELSLYFGDDFFVGIFALKFFFFFSCSEGCLFLSFGVSFAMKMLLGLIISLWPIFILFFGCGFKKNLL